MMAFVSTVCVINYPAVVSSGIVVYEFRDKVSWGQKQQALMIWEQATESYIVEVITESSI